MSDPIFLVMDDVDSDLADFTGSVLPNSSSKNLMLETLQTLGVETLEDLKYVQESDLVNILRPAEFIQLKRMPVRFLICLPEPSQI